MSSDNYWNRRRLYHMFYDAPLLSPVPEEASPNSSDRACSPLPELEVEVVPKRNRHDHDDEFYRRLHIRMRRLYRKLFIEGRGHDSSFSTASDDDVIGWDEELEEAEQGSGEWAQCERVIVTAEVHTRGELEESASEGMEDNTIPTTIKSLSLPGVEVMRTSTPQSSPARESHDFHQPTCADMPFSDSLSPESESIRMSMENNLCMQVTEIVPDASKSVSPFRHTSTPQSSPARESYYPHRPASTNPPFSRSPSLKSTSDTRRPTKRTATSSSSSVSSGRAASGSKRARLESRSQSVEDNTVPDESKSLSPPGVEVMRTSRASTPRFSLVSDAHPNTLRGITSAIPMVNRQDVGSEGREEDSECECAQYKRVTVTAEVHVRVEQPEGVRTGLEDNTVPDACKTLSPPGVEVMRTPRHASTPRSSLVHDLHRPICADQPYCASPSLESIRNVDSDFFHYSSSVDSADSVIHRTNKRRASSSSSVTSESDASKRARLEYRSQGVQADYVKELLAGVAVGSPRVYNLCRCLSHVCQW